MSKTRQDSKRGKIKKFRFDKRNVMLSLLCLMIGVIFYFAAEAADESEASVEKGILSRSSCGKGDTIYEFYVDGLGDENKDELFSVSVTVPERKMTSKEFYEKMNEMADSLNREILGENKSLQEVRSDLVLVKELEDYGVRVTWSSERPEIISTMGIVEYPMNEMEEDVSGKPRVLEDEDCGSELNEITVYLEAVLTNGVAEGIVEIPVIVYPPDETLENRFLAMLEELVTSTPEQAEIVLPKEFEGKRITYRTSNHSKNLILPFLGVVAAVCMLLKGKSDQKAEYRRRESSLMEDYSDLVSEFLILTGAGYTAKAAWKKLTSDYQKTPKKGKHPLYEEMQITINQMETGMPETLAYADFGRRCQLRCYVKFASLLESSVSTGGKNLRRLLEGEMEEAFKQRTDIAKRKGEELSSKMLMPMFGMLGIVMIMVVAPAFLNFS